MAAEGLAAFLVPRADVHQGETVAPRDERLAWLTGFTGSAGSCAVTMEEAGLFVDGRYRVQARAQADPFGTSRSSPGPGRDEAPRLARLAPRLGRGRLRSLAAHGAGGRGAARGPGRGRRPAARGQPRGPHLARPPGPARRPVLRLPRGSRGRGRGLEARAHRRRAARGGREGGGADAARLDRVAPQHPRRRRGAHAGAPRLRDPARGRPLRPLRAARQGRRGGRPPRRGGHGALGRGVSGRARQPLGPGAGGSGERARGGASRSWPTAGVAVSKAPDPCALPKARKNAVELAGAREAHIRDGAAMARFLAWLDAAAPGDRHRDRRGCAPWKGSGARRTPCATSRSTPSRARAPTAPSSTTASRPAPTAPCGRARRCWSIRAGSTSTAPPT